MADKQQGVVIATRGRHFDVLLPDKGRVRCELRAKVKRATDNTTPVAVGDEVSILLTDEQSGVIDEVTPRRSAFFRPTTGLSEIKQVIAANLDRIGIIVSVSSPPLKTGLIDRMAIAGMNGGMQPLLVINKIDLPSDDPLDLIEQGYRAAGFDVVRASTVTGEGIDQLRELLASHKTLFAGHSGVGKSSLLNSLLPQTGARIGDVSRATNKGKHTTTTVEMYPLSQGGFLVDSPGLKLMGLWGVSADELRLYYPEFVSVERHCRFSGCKHVDEPDCAVKEAVEGGLIVRFRYENYCQIRESLLR